MKEDRSGLSVAPAAARLGQLVRGALAVLATDREAARRCLNDVPALPESESADSGSNAQPARILVRTGSLALWQAKRALTYIEANLEAKITIRHMADVLGVSNGHFSRSFKVSVGCPPTTYLCRRRVERAKTMMTSSGQQLSEIALACGFADQSHLSRVFRRVMGVSPGVWRRNAVAAAPGEEYPCHL